MQFTGPTGTNAVEAALKLARNVTGRESVISFTNGFHCVSLGALAATGNSHHRGAAGVCLNGTSRIPYDGYLGQDIDTTAYLDKVLSDSSSGVDLPAAAIVETVQGEGGINVASNAWLQNLATVCKKHGVLLIIDDIQAGCGRTGTYLSFEEAGIVPDMVTLSKSLGGYGLPFAVVLFRPELDHWKPGEHNGTFRGNNHAFVTATAALRHFWSDESFAGDVRRRGDMLAARLERMAARHGLSTRGRGMMRGLNVGTGEISGRVTSAAFERGVIMETSGSHDETVKVLAPLVIDDDVFAKGLDILENSVDRVFVSNVEAAE
jgi:diaminobutyrate-2-oxoglutarate transaminase